MIHADYPHHPGTLYDCPVCESQCFCDPCASCRMRYSDCCTQCVFCALLEQERREIVESHDWQAGIMHVHPEDVLSIAAMRGVECSRCEATWPAAMACTEVIDSYEWEGDNA